MTRGVQAHLGDVHVQVLVWVCGAIVFLNSQVLPIGRNNRLHDAKDEEVLEL